MSERIQKTFTLSFNSKINSDLKMWEALQKLPKGFGKKLFQNLLEEKFGKSNAASFTSNMMKYLDLENDTNYEKRIIEKPILDKKIEVNGTEAVSEKSYKPSNDSLEM